MCLWVQCSNLQVNVLCWCICKEKDAFSSPRPLCWWVTWLLLWMHRATLRMPTFICRRRQIWQERSITLSCTWCSAIWLPSWYTEVGRVETLPSQKGTAGLCSETVLGRANGSEENPKSVVLKLCHPAGKSLYRITWDYLPENTDLHHKLVAKLQLESRSNFVVGGRHMRN